jgi:hypothetical protein
MLCGTQFAVTSRHTAGCLALYGGQNRVPTSARGFDRLDRPALDDRFEIDTTVAHAARRYNYWLGGGHC